MEVLLEKAEYTKKCMPTEEDDQDGHFFYNHPERGAYFAASARAAAASAV